MLHSLVAYVDENFRVVLLLTFAMLALVVTPNVPQETSIEVAQKVEKVAKAVDPKQLACLATNIYYEAGGEPEAGKAAVARVVMNRVNHGFAPTPCQVVYQTMMKPNEDGDGKTKVCQFTWVCEGKNNPNKKDPKYLQALNVAYNVLAHDAYKQVIPASTLFFHNLTVPIGNYTRITKIGNHIFYEKKKRKAVKAQRPVLVAQND